MQEQTPVHLYRLPEPAGHDSIKRAAGWQGKEGSDLVLLSLIESWTALQEDAVAKGGLH